MTDEPGFYLALGEAVNGPGGYFGGCPDALVDCLRGGFGHTSPATLLWRDASTAREHLSRALTSEGWPLDLLAEALDVLAEGGMHVTLA
ncbi:barstar family protein [Actinomadura luteofluorescens]|uniref:barstar family protein n=1 Tax=Actinomadura luteofluorescens TaxID=46163 RepID=UPI00363E4427